MACVRCGFYTARAATIFADDTTLTIDMSAYGRPNASGSIVDISTYAEPLSHAIRWRGCSVPVCVASSGNFTLMAQLIEIVSLRR
jgi:hypothetical protein